MGGMGQGYETQISNLKVIKHRFLFIGPARLLDVDFPLEVIIQ